MNGTQYIDTLIERTHDNVMTSFSNGDELYSYNDAFSDTWQTATRDLVLARHWLTLALSSTDFDDTEIQDHHIVMYQTWLACKEDLSEIAELKFVENGDYIPDAQLARYELPEFYEIASAEWCAKYPRVMHYIKTNGELWAHYDDCCGLSVCLSGDIVYVPSETHAKCASLIVQL